MDLPNKEVGTDFDPDVELAWLQEAERRWQEIESGAVTTIPSEVVKTNFRSTDPKTLAEKRPLDECS
jgi:hypothetical protein